MKAEQSHQEIRDLAAAYALGVLDGPETRALEIHLATGCQECLSEIRSMEIVTAQLAYQVPALKPRPQVRERLLAKVREKDKKTFVDPNVQVWRNWDSTPDASRWVIRSDEGDWQQTSYPGVFAKNLFVDADTQCVTMMIQMEPGSQYPSHQHAHAEQCFVIKGDIHVGEAVYQSGDYIRNATGSVDETISTVGGCLLFLISSLHDELLG